MTGRVAGKAAIVVGAGAIGPGWGNGRASAALLAREGARVLCVDRDEAAVEETCGIVAGEGGTASSFVADVTDSGQVAAMVAACVERYGSVDLVHNNVGIVANGNVVDMPEADWERVHRVNLTSVYLVCKHVVPAMRRQGGGAIVNTASTAGMRHMGISYCAYSSSKAAVIHLTRAIAMDHAREGIRCNCVVPGVIHTPLVEQVYTSQGPGERDRLLALRAEQIPLGRLGDAWDVAHAVLFLLSDEAKYITGADLVVDGGLTVKSI